MPERLLRIGSMRRTFLRQPRCPVAFRYRFRTLVTSVDRVREKRGGRLFPGCGLDKVHECRLTSSVDAEIAGNTGVDVLLSRATMSVSTLGSKGALGDVKVLVQVTDNTGVSARLPVAAVLAAAGDAGGLIAHLDRHIQNVLEACPGLSPSPNNPEHDPVRKWITEIKTAIANLRRRCRHAPRNGQKRKPIEDAIKRGEAFVKLFSDADARPRPFDGAPK